MSEFIEFSVHSPERFSALQRVFSELKRDKDAADWRTSDELLICFDSEALSHFSWPPADERLRRLEDLRTHPIIELPTEDSVDQTWDFDSLIDAFVNGEYNLLDCEMTGGGKARLNFDAMAYPYGGVGCMVALVEAFGCTVTGIDDGTGFLSFTRAKAVPVSTERYLDQQRRWPPTGRHILAHFDEQTIIVYQAYSPAIGHFAIRHQCFGGDFSYSRMSWIKPNFLWMMYRSDWGRSPGQEVVLAIRLKRVFFDSLLEQAVPSSFSPRDFASHEEWKAAVERSDVRLQWDPDHLPNGKKDERRAIQLGLRGATLEAYGKREIVEVIDMSDFVAEQCENAVTEHFDRLMTPVERPYRPMREDVSQRIGLGAT